MSNDTLSIGHTVIAVPQVASTNDYAMVELSKNNPSEGTVILTPNQTAGRGQIGSVWESAPDKNVAMTAILYPRFLAVAEQFGLSQVASLAVAEACARLTGADFKVKWPNDVYYRHDKVAGILIQNSVQGRRLGSSLVGIGLNVNQMTWRGDAPNPTSLARIAGHDLSLDAVYKVLFEALSKWYDILCQGQRGAVEAAYQGQLYRREVVSTFERREGTRFMGIIKGTTATGLLRVWRADEQEETFDFKSIKLLRP